MRGEEGAHLHQHDPVDQQVLLVAVPAVSAIPVIVINATIHTIHAIHATTKNSVRSGTPSSGSRAHGHS